LFDLIFLFFFILLFFIFFVIYNVQLTFPKNSEECANSLQFYIEEYVERANNIRSLARRAYISFLRSYSTYDKEMKRIFHLKNLHLGHVAKSFGLREAPKEIIGSELKLHMKKSSNAAATNLSSSSDGGKDLELLLKPKNKSKSKEDDQYEKILSKYSRDLKRLSNGHKEYGNVTKKNKMRSQKANLDLR
jgi:hypothetical protein